MASFDWYQGTIPQPVDDVLEAMFGLSDGLKLSHRRGMHGYGTTSVLGSERDGDAVQIWHGGSHAHPHAVLGGEWADPGAKLIRAAFPEHAVTRLDVKEDYVEEGAFDSIQAKLLAAARQHRVSVGTAGDHLLTMQGRTVYLGAPTSKVRMRLYDKRAEVLSKLPGLAAERAVAFAAAGYVPETFPDHWSRLEAQIRPQTRESKAAFASIEPVAALGSTAWMRDVWKAVEGLELTPVQVGRGYRVLDDDRAYAWLLKSAGPLLRRLHEQLGSWDCVGLQLGHDLAEIAKQRRGA